MLLRHQGGKQRPFTVAEQIHRGVRIALLQKIEPRLIIPQITGKGDICRVNGCCTGTCSGFVGPQCDITGITQGIAQHPQIIGLTARAVTVTIHRAGTGNKQDDTFRRAVFRQCQCAVKAVYFSRDIFPGSSCLQRNKNNQQSGKTMS